MRRLGAFLLAMTVACSAIADIPDPGRLVSAVSDGARHVTIHLDGAVNDPQAMSLWRDGATVPVASRWTPTPDSVVLALTDDLDITAAYTVADSEQGGMMTVLHRFDDAAYDYPRDDLGCTYTPAAATFRVWSPVASAVQVVLFDEPWPAENEAAVAFDMQPDPDFPGVFKRYIPGDHAGRYYAYRVTVHGVTREAPDLYSVGLGRNGRRSQVVDLTATDPDGWADDTAPSFPVTDSVIYQLHVRDFTSGEHWNGDPAHRGRYLGVVESGTSWEGRPTGFDHLRALGVNTVQLMPVFDFAGVDETDPAGRAWGYAPYACNVPEGSYASDPDDAAVRIHELKTMIQALHAAGMKVVIDVAYGYSAATDADTDLFDAVVPGYYHRLAADGTVADRAGVGNEVDTARAMARRFILQSCRYWVDEFHVDGLRLHRMGLLDAELVAEITTAVRALDPDALVFGEAWSADGAASLIDPGDQRGRGFACLNDAMRDAIRGSNVGGDGGFAMGQTDARTAVMQGVAGSVATFADSPAEVVNHLGDHHGYTWWDKLDHAWNPDLPAPGHDAATLARMARFGAAMLLTSQGAPLIHGGDEFLRTRRTGDPDQAPATISDGDLPDDAANALDWSAPAANAATVDYWRGLLALRRERPEFRLATGAAVRAGVTFLDDLPAGVVGCRLTDATPGDGWGDIVVYHNPADVTVNAPLPVGQWTQVVDAAQAGTAPLAGIISPDGAAAQVALAPFSAAVLYRVEAPDVALSIFQNAALDRFLHLAVNIDGDAPAAVAINGTPVVLADQGGGSWFGDYELTAAGDLVIELTTGAATLLRQVAVADLQAGSQATSADGGLTVIAPAETRAGGWLLLADRAARPDVPDGAWLVGAEGAQLDRPVTLRAPGRLGDVFQIRQGDRWRVLPTSLVGDGVLEAKTADLGVVRLAAGAPVPVLTRLLGAAPNPFNPATAIRFDLAAADATHPVAVRVYDVRGQLVRTAFRGVLPAGPAAVPWDGRDGGGRPVATGVYIYRLETASQSLAGRMLLVK
jgi:pullulanase